MIQEDYKTILRLRNLICERLDSIRQCVEDIKKDCDKAQQITFFRMIIELLLLVAHMEKGKKLFFDILEYTKDIDPEFADKYWKLYDKEIETIIEKEYFKVIPSNK